MTGNDMVGSGARTAAAVSAANAPAAPASPLPDEFSSTASAANAAAAASSGAAPCQCRSPERLASCAFACARPGRGRHHREHTPRTGLGQHWLQFMEYRARPALASIYGVRGPARSAPHTCTNAAPLRSMAGAAHHHGHRRSAERHARQQRRLHHAAQRALPLALRVAQRAAGARAWAATPSLHRALWQCSNFIRLMQGRRGA